MFFLFVFFSLIATKHVCTTESTSLFSHFQYKFTIRHVGNILSNLKKTSKTARKVGLKDILTSENPGNNSKLLIFKYFNVFSLHSFFFIRTSNFDAEAERSYIFWRFEAETFLKMFLNLPDKLVGSKVTALYENGWFTGTIDTIMQS